jgi:hypothetical protein
MAATQVFAFPKPRPSWCQTRRARAAEVNTNPASPAKVWHNNSWSAVAERLGCPCGIPFVKRFFPLLVWADGESSRWPSLLWSDLAAHHHGRGPAAMRNLRFPFDIVRLAQCSGRPWVSFHPWRDTAVTHGPRNSGWSASRWSTSSVRLRCAQVKGERGLQTASAPAPAVGLVIRFCVVR